MWEKIRQKFAEKIDVKITGYISVAMFAVAVGVLFYIIGLSAGAAGELPIWAGYAGFGIIVINVLAILFSRWGQQQTGRRLKANRVAIWLNAGLIGVMVLIYGFGIILSL